MIGNLYPIPRNFSNTARALRNYIFCFSMSYQHNRSLSASGALRKRGNQGGRKPKRQRIEQGKLRKEGSNEEILLADIQTLLSGLELAANSQAPEVDGEEKLAPLEQQVELLLPLPFTEIEVKVLSISSTGDGLAIQPPSKHIYVIPFTLPGDIVRVKVIRHFLREHYSLADFLEVIEPSPLRDDNHIKCKYFTKCSGCQYQMLDYPSQLAHKKTIVEKAYQNFSQLPAELVPKIHDTVGSPLQYGYRTKLTPHFDGPPEYRSRTNRKGGTKRVFEDIPDIGFMQKGQRKTLDIEDCPIGTEAVRMGMKKERLRVAAELDKYQRGATILLRESTERIPNTDVDKALETRPHTIKVSHDTYADLKTCITDNNATSTEYVEAFIFTNPAGSFFQNNNSILPVFTQYIRDHILPPVTADTKTQSPQIKFLIDAYCGSGLFTITLSSLFNSSTGIDISNISIEYALKNAALNNIPSSQASFIAADAPELFKSITYPADETVVIIDPPRKGCDELFLKQLLRFAPKRVVYVSCNVHTQARDVGILVNGTVRVSYKIESLRGFDFFPQTSHVEGVAVLSKVDQAECIAL
jgi:tRNA (uracil-5-)-methyltransferase